MTSRWVRRFARTPAGAAPMADQLLNGTMWRCYGPCPPNSFESCDAATSSGDHDGPYGGA